MSLHARSNRKFDGRFPLRCFPAAARFPSLALVLVANARSKVQESASPSAGAMQLSPQGQSQADVDAKNSGCLTCHVTTDEPTMHPTGTVRLACVDCHGGDSSVHVASGIKTDSAEYLQAKNRAHPKSSDPDFARTSANPVRSYTKWLQENYDYI